eukprot:TRINITY_DN3134_c0_g1_i1.p2 TRINITY_DN3134_c0_g1~~TRINITY_DN3134_c0_g1_i1.p2  ORF type:complete len:80 (+),score=7.46 TRINITY_DN3134_c0_g1_i1:354-593(+)
MLDVGHFSQVTRARVTLSNGHRKKLIELITDRIPFREFIDSRDKLDCLEYLEYMYKNDHIRHCLATGLSELLQNFEQIY